MWSVYSPTEWWRRGGEGRGMGCPNNILHTSIESLPTLRVIFYTTESLCKDQLRIVLWIFLAVQRKLPLNHGSTSKMSFVPYAMNNWGVSGIAFFVLMIPKLWASLTRYDKSRNMLVNMPFLLLIVCEKNMQYMTPEAYCGLVFVIFWEYISYATEALHFSGLFLKVSSQFIAISIINIAYVFNMEQYILLIACMRTVQ